MAEWYEEAFGRDFLRVYPHRDDAEAAAEVASWLGRLPGLDPGRRALDLACGAGRHLRALRGAGVRAVGCDLSRELLEEARARDPAPLVRADMRRLPFADGCFDAVVSFFSSFGYFPGEEEDARVLGEAARVLRPGGSLLLDLMDREGVAARLVPRSSTERAGVVIEEERRLTPDGRRVEKTVSLRAGPRGGTIRSWRESVRLYDPAEVETMAARAGLEAAGRRGDHRGAGWRPGVSPRCVLLFTRGAA